MAFIKGEKIGTEKLKYVAETNLITLYLRKKESEMENSMIKNQLYIDIVDRLDFDFSRFDKEKYFDLQTFTAARTLIFDNAVKSLIDKYKDPFIVNFGAGFGIRFYVTDNGKITWFDIDLPEVIELRKQIFKESDRNKFIGKSIFNDSWKTEIPKGKDMIFVAEGLLLYFEEETVKNFILGLLRDFPSSDLIIDVISKRMLDYLNNVEKPDYIDWENNPFKWAIESWDNVTSWNEKISFIEEWREIDYYGDRCPFELKAALLVNPLAKNIYKVGHLKLG